jgi:hypothetical protein
MKFLEGPVPVLLEKGRLHDEDPGARREFHDLPPVLLAVHGVGHIGDFFPGRDPDDPLPEESEGKAEPGRLRIGLSAPDFYFPGIGIVPEDASFQLREPGAHGKVHLVEGVLLDVDMPFFLDGQGETGYLVIQEHPADGEVVPVDEETAVFFALPDGFPAEPPAAVVTGGLPPGPPRFGDQEMKTVRVVLHEVPGVGPEFSFHVVHETGGAEQVHFLVPAEGDPEEMVEADEVVHVGMGDEGMGHFQDFSRGQGGEIPHVEEKGFFPVPQFQENPGISERVIDQVRVQHGRRVLRVLPRGGAETTVTGIYIENISPSCQGGMWTWPL